MNYRKLGKTGLMVSEIGFGPEWMTGTPEETRAIWTAGCPILIFVRTLAMP